MRGKQKKLFRFMFVLACGIIIGGVSFTSKETVAQSKVKEVKIACVFRCRVLIAETEICSCKVRRPQSIG